MNTSLARKSRTAQKIFMVGLGAAWAWGMVGFLRGQLAAPAPTTSPAQAGQVLLPVSLSTEESPPPAPLPTEPLPTADGYQGIWYSNQPTGDPYQYKYSGGMATYPQQHVPIAYYSAQANKTFFVYGGRAPDANRLLHMVSYFDHATKTVPKPRILLDKKTDDAHDNPVLMLDGQGHLWIFSNAHGTGRPAYIHRSCKPLSIDRFERIATTNFSYGQPWHLADRGFCFLHTHYERGGRSLFVWLSADGRSWEERQPLARIELGHYQISWRRGERIGTAFNYHPTQGGLNARTNLYYLETRDGGRTWTNVEGQTVSLPIQQVRNPALVHDYQAEKRLVYLKDVNFDAQGRPVILYLTSRHYAPGPAGDPRIWHTAHWTGQQWVIREVARSDHNYDFGSLSIEPDGTWRIIAPTEPGPQPYTTGGEMVLWTSTDQGATWTKIKQLTRNSRYNHTYARRPVDAHPEFYALWADGDTLRPSESRLYFTDREGTHVWRLPVRMENDHARPEVVW